MRERVAFIVSDSDAVVERDTDSEGDAVAVALREADAVDELDADDESGGEGVRERAECVREVVLRVSDRGTVGAVRLRLRVTDPEGDARVVGPVSVPVPLAVVDPRVGVRTSVGLAAVALRDTVDRDGVRRV